MATSQPSANTIGSFDFLVYVIPHNSVAAGGERTMEPLEILSFISSLLPLLLVCEENALEEKCLRILLLLDVKGRFFSFGVGVTFNNTYAVHSQ